MSLIKVFVCVKDYTASIVNSSRENNNYLSLILPRGLFPIGFPVKIMKELLFSSILAAGPAHLNLLDLITLAILSERY